MDTADNRNWVRVTLACSTVSCVVAASGFRVVGTGLLAHYWDPETALKFFSLGGWLTFVFELTMLFVLHRLISRIWKGKRESKSAAQLPAITTGTSPAI